MDVHYPAGCLSLNLFRALIFALSFLSFSEDFDPLHINALSDSKASRFIWVNIFGGVTFQSLHARCRTVIKWERIRTLAGITRVLCSSSIKIAQWLISHCRLHLSLLHLTSASHIPFYISFSRKSHHISLMSGAISGLTKICVRCCKVLTHSSGETMVGSVCKRCRVVVYCSSQCQKADYKDNDGHACVRYPSPPLSPLFLIISKQPLLPQFWSRNTSKGTPI